MKLENAAYMVNLELLPTIQLTVDKVFSIIKILKGLNFQWFLNPYKFKINQLQKVHTFFLHEFMLIYNLSAGVVLGK